MSKTKKVNFSYQLTGFVEVHEAIGTGQLHGSLLDLTHRIMSEALITGDTEMEVDSYSTEVKVDEPLTPKYPVYHGKHIIQFHDETFVWYDEAGLHGGVEYSLKQAQTSLKRYAERLNMPKLDPAAFAPITAPGYEPGEIPHHFRDLNSFAANLLEQNDAMREVMVRAGMQICLAKARAVCECPPGTRNITEGGHFPACTACKRRLK